MGEELRDKVAIVTGAAQGMGRAVAERFAEEGAALALLDLREDRLDEVVDAIRARGGDVRAYPGDVADEERVASLVAAVLEAHGQVDVLVSCAGIMTPTRFHELTVEEWDRVVAVNLRGVFLLMRAVYPHMKERGDGRIVNFSSTAGLTVSTLGGAHYTASKHGVVGITKAVAVEGGPFGVRVNAVCPGLIDTEMVRSTIGQDAIRSYEASFPIPRLGTPAEVADLVLFLASDRSAYVTGAALNISGGDLV